MCKLSQDVTLNYLVTSPPLSSLPFFYRENHRITPPAHGGGSVRLTDQKPTSVAPIARYAVSRLNGSRGLGRQLARYRSPSIVLTALSCWQFRQVQDRYKLLVTSPRLPWPLPCHSSFMQIEGFYIDLHQNSAAKRNKQTNSRFHFL